MMLFGKTIQKLSQARPEVYLVEIKAVYSPCKALNLLSRRCL